MTHLSSPRRITFVAQKSQRELNRDAPLNRHTVEGGILMDRFAPETSIICAGILSLDQLQTVSFCTVDSRFSPSRKASLLEIPACLIRKIPGKYVCEGGAILSRLESASISCFV